MVGPTSMRPWRTCGGGGVWAGWVGRQAVVGIGCLGVGVSRWGWGWASGVGHPSCPPAAHQRGLVQLDGLLQEGGGGLEAQVGAGGVERPQEGHIIHLWLLDTCHIEGRAGAALSVSGMEA
jgi:hypothetical protein